MSAAPSTPKPHLRWALLATLPALVVAAWQASWPWPFFSDDAFVSLRYADRLLHGEGLTWTDGERVEGYSNLLWVIACAGLGGLGLDLVTGARALGALCTAGTLWLLAWALRPRDLRTCFCAGAAPMLVATSGTVMAWTLGGLEGPMVMLWLAWGFTALGRELTKEPRTERWSQRTLLRCGLPFALGCLTRPDTPLWIASAGLVLGLAAWRGGLVAVASRTALFAMLPLSAVLGQLAFRLAYYGDYLPNTAYVKAQFDPGSGAQGLHYVRDALLTLPGLTWPALAGFVVLAANRTARPLAIALALPTALWCAYLVAIGGDHFPGRRLMHGSLVPMALLGALGCAHLLRRTDSTFARIAWLPVTALVLAAAAFGLHVSRTDPKFVEVKHEVWEWRGMVLGEALARAFANERPRLACDSAGVVPFYSRLPALDMLGLCDRTIAQTPFREWLLDVKARGEVELPPGHLRGNGAYLMDQAPDLMLLGPPPGLPLPVFVSALEFEYDPRFRERYRCVLLDLGSHEIPPGTIEPIVAPLWVLLHGRVGVRSTADRIDVPAWLFGCYTLTQPLMVRRLPPAPGTPEAAAIARGLHIVTDWYYSRRAVAVPTANGSLELELRTDTASFTQRLPAGTWRAAIDPATAQVAVSATGCPPDATGNSFVVDSERDVVWTLARAAGATAAVRVRRVLLSRER